MNPLHLTAGIALVLTGAAGSMAAASPIAPLDQGAGPPNVLLVTIDTLRADRLSSYGYERPTSPHLDRLIAAGAKFTEARTVEPLTGPALCSLITSRDPHDHGATRNGLRMRDGLESLPRMLAANGFSTAAFLANWTLKDKVTGLAAHFETYEVVLTRKRWLGLVSSEAVGEDITDAALTWLAERRAAADDRPFFLWVHYVEPHAPYRLQERHRAALGLPAKGNLPPEDRYDTEVAEADRAVGLLLDGLAALDFARETLVAFTADHGEGLGEHNEWGHGRHLYETTLRIPLSLTWPGRIRPGTIDAPALITDLAPTIARLVGIEPPGDFAGHDFTGSLTGGEEPPRDRVTYHQAHRGVVLSGHDSNQARRAGLLEVATIQRGLKEVLRVGSGRLWRYDLARDPREIAGAAPAAVTSEGLLVFVETVSTALGRFDAVPLEPLDEESIEHLRALGYTD
jgi:arylsulfatase A-like enzyme